MPGVNEGMWLVAAKLATKPSLDDVWLCEGVPDDVALLPPV